MSEQSQTETFEQDIVADLARKVPGPIAKIIHEGYAHIGLIYAVTTFVLSRVSTDHIGPEWLNATAGLSLFVIGKFSSQRVPTSFAEVVADVEADVPAVARVASEVAPVVAKAKKSVSRAKKGAQAVVAAAEAVDPAVAPEVAKVEAEAAPVVAKAEQVATGPQGAALAQAAQDFLNAQRPPQPTE